MRTLIPNIAPGLDLILIARPGFKRLNDFKGRRIGVSGLGSAPHIILREALIQAGMNPDRDVTTIAVGGSFTATMTVNAPSKTGTITVNASVTSATPDPNSSNNSATETTTIQR